jgi:hypothetical protein
VHRKIVDGADYTDHKKIPLKEYCQHQRLKEVKLSGFRGFPIQFDLAILLLKNALLLEKMRIVIETTYYQGFARGSPCSILLAFSQSYVKYDLRKNKIIVLFFC